MVRARDVSKGRAPEITVAAGELVVRQGEPGSDMYVIASGSVRITRTEADGTVTVLGTRGRGEFFGEMSVLESMPRSATVEAIEDTRLLVISQGQLLVRIRRDPTFCLELLRQLSGALRRSTPVGDPAALP
ncbi:MAG: cyclic nucleotide-binding domain-containing protein [Acidimicrobiia bacterium]|nr:cyclic nucleotide-binding domain-containing protein [Acidimicrobiia bacterium]